MKGIACSDKPYATVKVVWFDVVVPDIVCKFAAFLSSYIGGRAIVVDVKTFVEMILIDSWICCDGDELRDIDIDDTKV